MAQRDFNEVLEKALAKVRRDALQAKQNPAAYTADRFDKRVARLETALVPLLSRMAATQELALEQMVSSLCFPVLTLNNIFP